MVQALEDGMVSEAVFVVGEKGACSDCSSRVMPENVPSEQPQWELIVSFGARLVTGRLGTLWNAKRPLNN